MSLPTAKVIAHVDLDAFYAQVEMQRDPERLSDKPVGVIQYNPWGDLHTYTPESDRIMNDSNGSLIAVNYKARESGVKRNHSGQQARQLCPDIQLVQVPTSHGKADLTIYRNAGKHVLDLLKGGGGPMSSTIICERASIDECYLDVTAEAQKRLEESAGIPPLPINLDQVHIYTSNGQQQEEAASSNSVEAWYHRSPEDYRQGELLIAAGAAVVAELRHQVFIKLGYTCSAGISHTKLLAKLCSGLHKPAQQTVLPAPAVASLLNPLPIPKLRALGGQFGRQIMEDLSITTVGQLAAVPISRLEQLYGDKDAHWLAALAQGIDGSAVEERQLAKSVSCGKTFRGSSALIDIPSIHTWLLELASELEERLSADQEANSRVPTTLTVHFGVAGKQGSISRSCQLRKTTAAAMAEDATSLIKKWTSSDEHTGYKVTDLYLGASNFQTVHGTAITKFFKPAGTSSAPVSPAPAAAEPSTSNKNTSSSKPLKLNGEEIDPDVWAALPADVRKELEQQAKFDALKATLDQGGKKRPAAQQHKASTSKKPMMDFLKGKRP